MHRNARASLAVATVIAGVFAFWGGWARRWMSDDGLIVLRTVRNLLAGNGPVFNVGERVEANTSTLWQYLITAVAWLTDGRLEDIATALALTFTVLAASLGTYASGRFWQLSFRRALPVIPFGIIIYLALPPARDFATSGLEWGLALFWLAIWWALLVEWATPARRAVPSAGYLLAFWCGLSWLVRPEFALYGGVTGILLIAYPPRKTPGILAAALPVPAAYQIFRMGYYGLLTPHTAVAKSAADSQWGQGWNYMMDFAGPYALWLPVVITAAVLVLLGRRVGGRRLAIVLLVAGCALAHVLYVLRVGGDFMHGRMLLLPLFALLLPVLAVPYNRGMAALATVLIVWATVIVVRSNPVDEDNYQGKNISIVDERDFWTVAVGRERGNPPQYAEDFLGLPMMRHFTEKIAEGREEDAAQATLGLDEDDPELFEWWVRPRIDDSETDLNDLALTAYWINLGMTSMNTPLDVRVLDTVGLATPLAARMPRDLDGRVGHDKQLPEQWQVADTALDLDDLPDWFDIRGAKQARAALRTEDIAELLASSREPMSRERFFKNIRYALGPGRTLQLDDDPSTYLDAATLRAIRNGEDPGLHSDIARIAWPTR
ncbi:hypothetical protein M5J20_05010 [Corynebacterium sp. TA-R-1]|uniref:Terminal beta-(1->2)-arabinofuranosyltransferase C-terminal domain-containing protein n=1 Tax=Corynebacterium stercoris TaxID=2943490 RepID=A0ABT1G128_9CORY|nr:hypothetical protein [Corynebacterium stercoris]MCP1387547.1 hypothetical protein [Corynebacterium stercoris]